MFTRNKKNYRTFLYSAIVVTLCLLVIALAWPVKEVNDDPSGEQDAIVTNENSQTEDGDSEEVPAETDTSDPSGTDQHGENSSTSGNHGSEETNISENGESYYLVKRAGEQIIVYFCDGSGETVPLETTQILYEVLGPEDQKLFDEGIKVNSQEELGVLLQDFES